MRRAVAIGALSLGIALLVPSTARAGWWDFQKWLEDAPTTPYEAGETNPSVWPWGIRIERTNCEAKLFLQDRSSGVAHQQTVVGGCSVDDIKFCYDGHDWSASEARNTDTSPPDDVWVNVRVDQSITSTLC